MAVGADCVPRAVRTANAASPAKALAVATALPFLAISTASPGAFVPRPRFPEDVSVILLIGTVVPTDVVLKLIAVPWAVSVQVSACCPGRFH